MMLLPPMLPTTNTTTNPTTTNHTTTNPTTTTTTTTTTTLCLLLLQLPLNNFSFLPHFQEVVVAGAIADFLPQAFASALCCFPVPYPSHCQVSLVFTASGRSSRAFYDQRSSPKRRISFLQLSHSPKIPRSLIWLCLFAVYPGI